MEEFETERPQGERIAKYLSACGVASRRNCEQYVVDGRVTVNGEAVTSPAHNVDPEHDQVRFDGKLVTPSPQGKVYLMLNKPAGYTCSAHDVHAQQLVYQLIPAQFGRVFTIGRLDRDSEGLLLLTNDGDFAQQVVHPSKRIYKRYYVECAGRFTTSIRRRLLDGMYDNGEFLQALAVEQKSVQRGICVLEIVLGEGRKREVRRLCKDVGLKVLLLRRIAIGQLRLDSHLKPGGWRVLTENELKLAVSPVELPVAAANAPRPAEAKPYWMYDRDEREAHRGRPRSAGGGGPRGEGRSLDERRPRGNYAERSGEGESWNERRPRGNYAERGGEGRPRGNYAERGGEGESWNERKPRGNYAERGGEGRPRGNYAERGGQTWGERKPRNDFSARGKAPSRSAARPSVRPTRHEENDSGGAPRRPEATKFRRKGPPRGWR